MAEDHANRGGEARANAIVSVALLPALAGERGRADQRLARQSDRTVARRRGRNDESAAVEKETAQRIAHEKLEGNDADALRLELRRAKSVAEWTSLRQWLETLGKDALPKSPTGKAVAYALNHWEALNRHVEYGWLSIDNNAAERALRPIAVGRNNWLFVGSQTGGETAAILFSLTSSCRRNGIDPFAYLRDVFGRLPDLRNRSTDPEAIAALLPHRWTPPTV